MRALISLLLAAAVAAFAADGRTPPWAPGHTPPRSEQWEPPPAVGQWEGREAEAIDLVKNYEPPTGAGTVGERVDAFLAALGPGDGAAALPWRAEQLKGPLYKVILDASTAQGPRVFVFRARVDTMAVEPVSKPAHMLFQYEAPEGFRFPGVVVVKTLEEAAEPARSPADVEAAAATHRDEIKNLYEEYLEEKPALRGRVAVNFVVRADGKVAGATAVRSTTGDAAFDAAVAALVATWTFPPAAGDVNVFYPFAFGTR